MKRILIAILTALTLLAGWTPTPHAADRTPLLMEGKKTLYQRVITHPGDEPVRRTRGRLHGHPKGRAPVQCVLCIHPRRELA